MAPSGTMSEVVTAWDEGAGLEFRVEDASPLRSGEVRYRLSDAPGGTTVEASFDYDVRFGPLGPVIDRLVVHRQLSAAWHAGLDGFRRHAEYLATRDGADPVQGESPESSVRKSSMP